MYSYSTEWRQIRRRRGRPWCESEAQHPLFCTFVSPMVLPLLHPCDFQSCWGETHVKYCGVQERSFIGALGGARETPNIFHSSTPPPLHVTRTRSVWTTVNNFFHNCLHVRPKYDESEFVAESSIWRVSKLLPHENVEKRNFFHF